MRDLIQKLVAVPGPPGFEGKVRELIKTEIAPAVAKIEVDPLGNLIVHKGFKEENGLRIMLSAHMDEVGVIATHIDKHGFVRFSQMGMIYPNNCLAAHVAFLNGSKGIVHGERLEDPGKVHSLEQLFIDVGASSAEDCPVHVGDMGIFEQPYMEIKNRIISKALDDRVGCAILIEVIRQLTASPHEVICVFSSQEEVGIRGVTSAAYSIAPDLGIAIDVTSVGDTPKSKMEVALGKGPAIKIRDEGMIADPRIVSVMCETAKRNGIPFQLEILKSGTTDARVIQISRAGVPAGCLSIPARYIHSPSEMVDIQDLQNSVRLFLELLRNPIELT